MQEFQSVVYITVTLFIMFISFVQLYRVGDACKVKTYEFRLSICFHSTRGLPVLHNEVIKIKFGTFNVFSQERLLGLK